MSERLLTTLVKGLLALVVLYGLVLLVGRGGRSEPAQGGVELQAVLTEAGGGEASALQAVVFAAPALADPIRLELAGGRWSADGHPADSANVARFLTALAEAEVEDLVSINSANHGRMGLLIDSAATMVLEHGEASDTVLLGSQGPSFGSVYARLPSEDEVYLVAGDLRTPALRALDQWRSKRVLALDTGAVASLLLRRGPRTLEVVRAEAGWQVGDQAADSTTIRNLLSELASLQASGFAAGGPPEDMADRELLVQAVDGSVLATLRLWEPADDGGTSLRLEAEGQVTEPGVAYTVSTFRADRLAPEPDRILPEAGDSS